MPRGNLGPDQAAAPYTSRDIRYTAREGLVYAFLMAWPAGGAPAALGALSSAAAVVGGVRLLCADGGRGAAVGWRQTAEALLVDLPLEPPPMPCAFAFGLRIEGVTRARKEPPSAGDGRCPAGFYCQDGPGSRRDCPAGHYCPAGSTAPTPCGPGTQCEWGLESPGKCPCGHSCPSGLNSPVLCPARNYCPAGASSPVPCPAGSACPDVGMCSPRTCLAGTYQVRNFYIPFPCSLLKLQGPE